MYPGSFLQIAKWQVFAQKYIKSPQGETGPPFFEGRVCRAVTDNVKKL